MIKPACGGSSRGRFGITMRGTMELDVRVRVSESETCGVCRVGFSNFCFYIV